MNGILALGVARALAGDEDPHLWLEAVDDDKALTWVKEKNQVTLGELTADPRFAPLRDRIQAIYDNDANIPYVAQRAEWYYNFWQDQEHQQGLWRRTTPESYATENPEWEVLLDLDALSEKEGKSWVWHGSTCLPPEYRRCLVSLSPGGSDADVMREFDTVDKAFVEGGFALPEAKGSATWVNVDTLLVETDFGEGTLTDSGYPRQVKRWTRGTRLSEATLVFEGQQTDVSVGAGVDHTPGFEREFLQRGITFYSGETWVGPVGGPHEKLDVPLDANPSVHREWLLVELRTDWEVGGKRFPGGSLLVTPYEAFRAGGRDFTALFTPTDRTALASWTATRHHVVLNVLDNVRSRVEVWTPSEAPATEATWASSTIPGLPALGTLGVSAVDPDTSDDVWLTLTDFVTPTTLSRVDVGKGVAPTQLKALPSLFDTAGLEVTQHEAISADGTKIPYFQVGKAGVKHKGKTPTLLYGYGGFEVSMVPTYNAAMGAAWLERGGVYVYANIRGGGEFGPRWHQAALKENRHKAYEDFVAIADDLVKRKITRPSKLGAMGGSNGGLLMGNMLTQYPDRFGAIVCQVPLLDMRRYHTLLAGASWMGEYGDPDDPEQWKFIQTFSPYHLADPEARYPRTLFTTSTRDDRVHPGHARKMVAKLSEQGHDVLYWENIEGGHGGAANSAQRATMWALSWVFLSRELGLP